MSKLISKMCVFCLKPVTNYADNASQGKEASFQRFFSFLERLFRQRLSPWMSGNSDFHKLLNICVCEDCSKLVDSFCEVYHQISCLELELNWKLETLRNVMKGADAELASVKRYDCESTIKCEGGGGNGGEGSTAEDIVSKTYVKFRATRVNLIGQCTNYLSNSYPRIVIDNCGGGRNGDDTHSSGPSRQESFSEIYVPVRDDFDPELLQKCFFGWMISFVTVVLLFLLDSNTNTASANFNSTKSQLISDVEREENYADFSDCNENYNDESIEDVELECEGDTDITNDKDREVNDEIEIVIAETTSNTEGAGALEEVEQSTITEDLSIKHNHQENSLIVEENVKSLESATLQLKDDNAQDNTLNMDSSHGESLTPTQELEESAPISMGDSPDCNSDSDGSDTLMHKKRYKLYQRRRPRQVCTSLIATFKFQCPKCSSKYKTRKDLNKHIRIHRKCTNPPRNCVKTKISQDGLTIQQVIERKHGKFQCAVETCAKKFLKREDLKRHSKLHGIFPCNFCDQISDFAPDLAMHEAQFHAGIPQMDSKPDIIRLNCARCDSRTFAKFKYLYHFLDEHLGLSYDKIRCPICQVPFDGSTHPLTLARAIYVHYTAHHGKSTSGNAVKIMRKRVVHAKGSQLFPCDKCLRTFRFKASLESHMLSHETTVPVIEDDALEKVVQEQNNPVQLPSRPRQLRNIHKCPVCKRTFSNLSNLESHQESCYLDNAASGMISDEDGEDDECKFEVKRFKKEVNDDVDEFDMGWKDGSAESDESSSCDDMDSDIEIELGPQASKVREVGERSFSQNQNGSGQDPNVVPKLSSESQPFNDTNKKFNNANAPSKSVEPLSEERPRRSIAERVKKNCPQCPFQYSNERDLITHMHTHFNPEDRLNFKITPEGLTLKEYVFRKKGKFSCRVKLCGKKFQTNDEFNSHSQLHGSFQCTVCSTVKKFAPDLAIHEANHRKETAEKLSKISGKKFSQVFFNCARCLHKTTGRNSCINHLLETHLGISNDKIRCTICNAVFQEPPPGSKNRVVRMLYLHYSTHHGGAPGTPVNTLVHKCGKCPAYFLTLIQLETHNVKEHGSGSRKDDNSTCSDCGKIFVDRTYLRHHRENVHKVEMCIACPVEDCDQRFETELDLEHHTRGKHVPSRTPVPCPICGRLVRKEYLQRHLPTHDPNYKKKFVHKIKFVCDLCGKTSKTTEQHKTHLLSHSGPESWEFACDTCGKKCLTRQKLNEHMRTHTKEKSFVCDTCGQAYAHRHNLRIHVNSKHETKDIARTYDKWQFNNHKKSSKKKNTN